MGLQAEKNWKEKLWASRDGIGIGTVLVVPHWHTFCIIATLSVLRSLSRCDHRPMFFGSRSMMLLCLSFCLRNPSLCSTTLPRRKQVYCLVFVSRYSGSQLELPSWRFASCSEVFCVLLFYQDGVLFCANLRFGCETFRIEIGFRVCAAFAPLRNYHCRFLFQTLFRPQATLS